MKINYKYIFTILVFAEAIPAFSNFVLCSDAEKAVVSGVKIASDGKAGIDISTAAAGSYPQISFVETRHDFGKAKEGDKVVFKYFFSNTGNKDLVIDKLRPSCGCTAAVVSTGPYHPGDKGFIDVSYNSYGKVGYTLKDIAVYSNDPKSPHVVSFEGTITSKERSDAGHGAASVGE